MEKIVSHDFWDWQSSCVNDVKAIAEEEWEELKEADAYDRTENKMSNGKCLFLCLNGLWICYNANCIHSFLQRHTGNDETYIHW